MNYEILEDTSSYGLSEQVNALIKSDHGTPVGGVSVFSQEDRHGGVTYRFFQAILTR